MMEVKREREHNGGYPEGDEENEESKVIVGFNLMTNVERSLLTSEHIVDVTVPDFLGLWESKNEHLKITDSFFLKKVIPCFLFMQSF